MLNFGHIQYLNCTPLFTALQAHFDCGVYRFVDAVPARLNAMLRAGELDLTPTSSIEYAMAPEQYCLLPGLSISAVGPVLSVLLLSTVPIEELDGRPIGLTTESDTSVNLLKVLLAKRYGLRNTFERTSLPVDEGMQHYPGMLVIGDAALKAVVYGSGSGSVGQGRRYCYDLGELWKEFTGLPFVFALWIVRRKATEEHGARLRQLAEDLLAAKQLASESYAQVAARCPERAWLGEQGLVEYWRTLSYDLTPAHMEGVKTFYRYAWELGLIPGVPELRFLGEDFSISPSVPQPTFSDQVGETR
eukprot:RCo026918